MFSGGSIRRIRRSTLLPALLALLLPAAACGPEAAERETDPTADPALQETRSFQGAWFQVAYPASFEARPSLPSRTADGYDSAFFQAPDGSVRFYVHSPQWGGEAADVARDPATEELVDSTTTTDGPVTTTAVTIAARDGSWTRSYTTTGDQRGPTRWTVGWGWASEEARDRWAPAFQAFRRSLEQRTH